MTLVGRVYFFYFIERLNDFPRITKLRNVEDR